MKKKRLIGIIIICIIAIILIGIVIYANRSTPSKEEKANQIFGTEYCDVILHMATMDLAPHTCKICGANFEDSSMNADICKECAKETNRCSFCARKLGEKEI